MKNGYRITTTPMADGKIEHLTERVTPVAVEAVTRQIMNTKERQTREALIQLGWTPPTESSGLSHQADALQAIANRVCQHCPSGYVISLCMEDGAAWVQLDKGRAGFVGLPDAADKTLLEQLNDALCVANGWSANDFLDDGGK